METNAKDENGQTIAADSDRREIGVPAWLQDDESRRYRGSSQRPVGNVYYYFKTKDEIGEAIVEQRLLELRTLQEQWDQRGSRKNGFWPVSRIRLKTGIYLRAEDVPSDSVLGIAQEGGLWRRRRRRSHGAAGVDRGSISGDWTKRHLTKACYPTSFFIAGSIGPGSRSGDPELVAMETKRLKDWVGGF